MTLIGQTAAFLLYKHGMNRLECSAVADEVQAHTRGDVGPECIGLGFDVFSAPDTL